MSNIKGGSTISKCGPETITISKVISSGAYRFHVYAYDQANNNSSTHIGDNETYVTVFYDNESYNFDAPKRTGNLWTVFDFDNSTGFTQINAMSDVDDVQDVDNY